MDLNKLPSFLQEVIKKESLPEELVKVLMKEAKFAKSVKVKRGYCGIRVFLCFSHWSPANDYIDIFYCYETGESKINYISNSLVEFILESEN